MADVVMPQMGESIAEGTIVRWIKKVGDRVERDEPLFEISTDKVDAEIPSPAAGVLKEIRAREGETVPINTVVALIAEGQAGQAGQAGQVGQAKQEPREAAPGPPGQDAGPTFRSGDQTPSKQDVGPALGSGDQTPSKQDVGPALGSGDQTPSKQDVGPTFRSGDQGTQPAASSGHDDEQRTSPLVRRIAKEHNVDLSKVRGTGLSGRVTKDDILAFLGQAGQASQAGQDEGFRAGGSSPRPAAPASPGVPAQPAQGLAGKTVPMSVMRRKIAEHMVISRRTSAHVHSVFEVNFAKVDAARQAKKAEFERANTKLTYLTFILKAVTSALGAVPVVNASVDGDNIVYHKDVNVGIAVALDWGLIVPVVKHADRMSLVDLSRAVADLADRARRKQLKPDEVSGGTFTITNPGVFGALFGMPIINQPQVAILGVGAIEKRPIVIDDAIAIRPMGYLSLGYDHRIIDGAVADQFLAHLKETLEHWSE